MKQVETPKGEDAVAASPARSHPAIRLVSRVDDETGFASDFLNQFNEVVMLLDCVASGDIAAIDDLVEWTPRSYAAHFAAGRLVDRFDIIRAYRLAPKTRREPLDAASRQLSVVVTAGTTFMAACQRAGADDSIIPLARHVAADVRRRLALLAALVHARSPGISHSEVSVLFAHCR